MITCYTVSYMSTDNTDMLDYIYYVSLCIDVNLRTYVN